MIHRRSQNHFLGCLLGGAVGDALGAAIEFDSLAQIRRNHGPSGLTDYASAYGRVGAITDDTQMTLFTAEALLRAHNRMQVRGICSLEDVAHKAYLRWLHTQGEPYSEPMMERGWLVQQRGLHSRRAPGNSCLSALHAAKTFPVDYGTPRRPINNSKGCGGVMRMAPVGLATGLDPFEAGCNLSAITHGHPTGYLASGGFAHIISELAQGNELRAAVESALDHLTAENGQETRQAVRKAVSLAERTTGTAENVEQLGQGWIAEEALAIGVYCSLAAKDFEHGVLLAVNHGGDSDSTGSIAGNILGLVHGMDGISRKWLERLELCDVISRLAEDLWLHFGEGDKPNHVELDKEGVPHDWDRYPGN